MRWLLLLLVVPGPALALPLHAPLPANAAPEEEAALSVLRGEGCELRGLTAAEDRVVRSAAARVTRALADPEVVDLLRSKTDWVVEEDAGWRTKAVDVPLALRWERLIGVFVLDGGCDVAGGAEALTVMGTRAIVLRAPLLAPGQEVSLSRTLIHEALHVLGYTHPDATVDLGGVTYNNSVPVYVGCILQRWPDLVAARRDCHQPGDHLL
ncbi:MAG: hypothetical protein AMXMBFR64_02550 [Myxococcales bacterium]